LGCVDAFRKFEAETCAASSRLRRGSAGRWRLRVWLFLGNSQNLKEIGDYPMKASDAWAKEAKTIFSTYCKSPMNTKYEERNKIQFTITKEEKTSFVLEINLK
jgi:hypothetical protein